MNSTRRSFLLAALGAAAAACSDGGVVNLSGDGGGGADSAVDAAVSADGSSDADAGSTGRIFVGDVTNSDAEIGIVVEGSKGFVFFCGGATSFSTLTRWFRGDVSLASFTLTDASGAKATGALQSDGVTVTGTYDLGDAGSLAFTAKEIAPGTVAGLYEANDAEGTYALIAPTAQWDALGAFKLGSGVVQQVVPLMPAPTGFNVRVTTEAGVRELLMTRAHPR
jgi:hypothetical protein